MEQLNNLKLGTTILSAFLLLGVLWSDLLVPLYCGFLVYELVHRFAPRLQSKNLSQKGSKLTALILLSLLVVSSSALVAFFAHNFIQGKGGGLSALSQKMVEILQQTSTLPDWFTELVPTDLEEVKDTLMTALLDHRTYVQDAGRSMGLGLAHALIGLVVGGLACVQEGPNKNWKPFAAGLASNISRFRDSFGRVVFAQVKISAINTLFTGIFLLGVLPILGYHLPLAKSLVVFTFVCGLLPVVGNLISNGAVVIISLSHSVGLAFGSLGFLIVIHKLEYFLNARIIGTGIKAKAWELLVAMLVLESVFGLKGLIAAPVFYAYLKSELRNFDLI